MWFDEIREIPKEHIHVLNEKFGCPDTFIREGFMLYSDSLDFYLNEFSRGLKIDWVKLMSPITRLLFYFYISKLSLLPIWRFYYLNNFCRQIIICTITISITSILISENSLSCCQ